MAERERDDPKSTRAGGESDRERAERLRERARQRWARTDDGSNADGSPHPADVDAVAAGLDSEDAEERARAAWTLAELATEHPDLSWQLPVDSKLGPLLDDDDPWVRRGASWALATIADNHPQRARAAISESIESLVDDDPLVRENGVLAVAGVAREYPLAAEPALGKLADLVSGGDGLAQQYAAEALRRLVTRLDENGFPRTIEATSEIADVLSGDVAVVEVTDDPSDGMPIQLQGSGASEPEREDDGAAEEDDDPALGPPDEIPTPPAVEATRAEFDCLGNLGSDPLTTTTKARAPSGGEGSQHVVVAIRTLRSDVDVDSPSVERAFRAWEMVDDHDHVLPVLARGSTPRPWLATEFPDGTLRNDIGSIGFERALWYAHGLTTAVCHAHARGVLHGALRPGSVALSRVLGAWPVPKLGDWGFGELLADVRDLPVPPAYAAPEHVAPETFGRLDHATDVYQLGALCYALFAGRPPFTGEPAGIVRKVRTADPAPPSAFADVPEAVDDLLARALTKQKTARFETAEDFRRELEIVVAEFGSTDEWRP